MLTEEVCEMSVGWLCTCVMFSNVCQQIPDRCKPCSGWLVHLVVYYRALCMHVHGCMCFTCIHVVHCVDTLIIVTPSVLIKKVASLNFSVRG